MANITSETANKLRALLASWAIFRQKTHSYHWNVAGKNFLEYHKLFGDLYDCAVDHMDTIAERLKQLKEPTVNTLAEMIQLSQVSDSVILSSDSEMLKDIMVALNQISVLQSEIWAESNEVADVVTNDLMVQNNKWIELQLWFLESLLK